MNLGTKITIYKFTPQVFTLTREFNQEFNQNLMNATINVVCYKWKTLANGEYPINAPHL